MQEWMWQTLIIVGIIGIVFWLFIAWGNHINKKKERGGAERKEYGYTEDEELNRRYNPDDFDEDALFDSNGNVIGKK